MIHIPEITKYKGGARLAGLAGHRPDLLIADLRLPDGSGVDLPRADVADLFEWFVAQINPPYSLFNQMVSKMSPLGWDGFHKN